MDLIEGLMEANRRAVTQLPASRHADYPSHVHMETYAYCNAACGFCPPSTLDRKGTRMPDAPINKIIDELSEIPPFLQFRLAPYKFNEPFLDKRLPDIWRRSTNACPTPRSACSPTAPR
ncbi:MAG: hypothetical protein QF926_07350 [Alphaproteobacteria bacterium]|jgi:hypothetical protein|nr:hypothetical protein [Alphaproteobacteria bacterium]MDP6516422.1 hypothetical protein [Alphaproteobacteria bacterium]